MRWLLVFSLLLAPSAQADEALWNALRGGGHVLIVRHALTTPGVGDPAEFRLDDCATQRKLSEEGRAQARRLGEELRRQGIPVGEVLSSPWCRCLDTARLAFGRATPWPPLANLYGRAGEAEKQVRALRPRIAAHAGRDNLVLVSHGSTALALTGEHPAMGEFLVLKPQPGGFRLAGRLAVP